jgi:hypothetical protein
MELGYDPFRIEKNLFSFRCFGATDVQTQIYCTVATQFWCCIISILINEIFTFTCTAWLSRKAAFLPSKYWHKEYKKKLLKLRID